MKQKNLILVAVAVGCGLVAAFLTASMRGVAAKAPTVRVLVAKKEVPVGWKIGKNEVNEYAEYKEFSQDTAPPITVEKPEDLGDKRLKRVIRVGEPFNPVDLTDVTPLPAPEGKDVMTFPASLDKAVAGFAGPGSKVNILATIRVTKRKYSAITCYLLTDMLVLAIDGNNAYPDKGVVFGQLSTVSLAVDGDQAKLLHAAIGRGSDLRLTLRNSEKPANVEAISQDELWKILADEPEKGGTGPGPKNEDDGEPEDTTMLPVLKDDVKAGEMLTADMVKMVPFKPPAPTTAVKSKDQLVGKYLTQDLKAEQWVPAGILSNKPPFVRPAPTEPGGKEKDPEYPQEEKRATASGPEPVYWEPTIQTASGVKKYRYELIQEGKSKGEWKLLGELRDDGSVVAP
jgi:Flp pilus assembly protein CpaB